MSIAASFAGFVGQDSKLSYTQGGMAVLSFSVATTHYDKQAENNRATQWVRCSWFGKRAETMAPHIMKGSSVFVRGTLKLNKFTTKDGEENVSLEALVDDVEFVGGKSDGQQRGAQGARPAPARAQTGQGASGTTRGQGGAGYGQAENTDAEAPGGGDDSLPF